MEKQNIALVLSSGGARGLAHIGVINELLGNGFNITSIAGTSMGALVGGIYATGQLPEFENWLESIDRRQILKLTDFSLSKKGFVKGIRIIDKMKEIVPDRNIEDLLIPYCAVATDIRNGNEKVFSEGNLYEAIRASISIPSVFQPMVNGSDYYVDGGVLNPIPADRIVRQDGDRLVVVNVNARIPFDRRKQRKERFRGGKYHEQLNILKEKFDKRFQRQLKEDTPGMVNITNKSVSLMIHKIGMLTLEIHKPDLLINISRDAFGTYDFYKVREIIEEGRRAAREAIGLTELISNPA